VAIHDLDIMTFEYAIALMTHSDESFNGAQMNQLIVSGWLVVDWGENRLPLLSLGPLGQRAIEELNQGKTTLFDRNECVVATDEGEEDDVIPLSVAQWGIGIPQGKRTADGWKIPDGSTQGDRYE